MKDNKYKKAMEMLNVREEFTKDTLFYIDSKKNQKEGNMNKIGLKRGVYGTAAALIVVTAAFILITSSFNKKNLIPLKASTGGVKVSYIHSGSIKPQGISSDYSIAELLEDDKLIEKYNLSIFQGTVEKIENIKIDFGGESEYYRAIASIRVEESYRGEEMQGDIVNVLLPCPIYTEEDKEKIFIEDTEVISQLKTGMKGIFLPKKYAPNDFWQEGGETLYLKDISDYGFMDGEQFVFLQGEERITYNKHTHSSLKDNPTMEDVKNYIKRIINND